MTFPFDARLAAWIAVAIVLIVTPGPDTALIIRNALRGGPRAATLSALGVGAGSAVWAAASMLGVAVLLEGSDLAFTLFKYAGASYLIYLGLRSLIGSFGPAAHETAEPVKPRGLAEPAAFAQGLLNNLLNPKAGAIFVTAMPQFIEPHDTAIRLIAMVVFYELIVIAWLCMYGYAVSRARTSPFGVQVRKGLERVTGAVMIGLGARLALERR